MAQNSHQLHGDFYGGVLPTQDDVQDHLFGVAAAATLPAQPIDLRGLMPRATDQGQTGSCGAHASAKLRHVAVNQWCLATGQALIDEDAETFSELWTYFWARKGMGTWPQDSGVDNRALLQAMLERGFALESDIPWDTASAPQDIQRDLSTANPPSDSYYGISGYERVGAAGMSMPASIAASLQQGRPCLVAIAVYRSFFNSDHAPMPGRGDQLLGYHDIPVHSWIPDGSAPGGGWFGWRVSWAGFGNGDGDAFLSASYVASSKYTIEAWRLV